MISKQQIAHIKQNVSSDSKETEIVRNMASALYDLIDKSKDSYLVSAKKASDYKPPKTRPQDFFSSLSFIAQASQLTRLAILLRATKVAPYTYENVDNYFYEGELIDKRYKLPEKGYERGALGGELSADHRKMFGESVIKGAVSNGSGNINSDSFEYWQNRLYPYGFKSNLSGRSYRWEDNKTERPAKYIQLVLDQFGITDFERKYKLSEFSGANGQLQDILSGQDQALIEADISETFKNYISTLSTDYKMLQRYYIDDYAADQSCALDGFKNAIERYRVSFFELDGGFVQQINETVVAAARAQEEKNIIKKWFEMDNAGHLQNPFSGNAMRHVRVDDETRDGIAAYMNARSDMVDLSNAEDDDTERFDDIKAQSDVYAALFEHLEQIDECAGLLKNQQMEIPGYAGQYNYALDIVNNAYELASNAALEIEHALLCTLKASGQYGPANLAEAFMAASHAIVSAETPNAEVGEEQEGQAVEEKLPLLGQKETTLEQLIALLNNDLRSNGWNGKLPESDKLPNDIALVMYPKHPYTWLESGYDKGLSVEELDTNIRQDIMHRQRSVKMLSDYLTKAKPMVSRRMQAEINVSLTLMQKQLMPALTTLAEAFPMDAENKQEISLPKQRTLQAV